MADNARVNGAQPDFQTHRFFFGKERFISLKSVGYGFDAKKKPIHGQPKAPIGHTGGFVDFKEFSFELLRAEADKLLSILSDEGKLDPTSQEFDFINTFRILPAPMKTDKLLKCKLNSGDYQSAQGEEPDMVKMTANVGELWINGIQIGKEDDE